MDLIQVIEFVVVHLRLRLGGTCVTLSPSMSSIVIVKSIWHQRMLFFSIQQAFIHHRWSLLQKSLIPSAP